MPARYECYVPTEVDELLQKKALSLYLKGRLLTRLKRAPEGDPVVPRYAIASYALRHLVDALDSKESGVGDSK